jgi:hypothetical protein
MSMSGIRMNPQPIIARRSVDGMLHDLELRGCQPHTHQRVHLLSLTKGSIHEQRTPQ